MHARTPAAVLAVAMAAAACDRDPEADHVAEMRAICASLAASGAGASEAEALLGPPTWSGCGSDFPPASGADRCPRDGTAICIRIWAHRAHQASTCGGIACSYGCELRAPAADPEATCAVRFLTGDERPSVPLP
ncbi:MAG TPA: hypothetical protein VEB43_11950 [Anaeromyxobacter sp.]|nr:hypothetical protein [Anaeromyxobacter sp.]